MCNFTQKEAFVLNKSSEILPTGKAYKIHKQMKN